MRFNMPANWHVTLDLKATSLIWVQSRTGTAESTPRSLELTFQTKLLQSSTLPLKCLIELCSPPERLPRLKPIER